MIKIFGVIAVLAVIALAKSEQSCLIDGKETFIPDEYDCDRYIQMKAEGYRFPEFPWDIIPPIVSTLWPNLTGRPTTPIHEPDDDDDNGCPAEGIVEIPHPDSCEKFILCVNGFEIPRTCPNDLHFSRELRRCVDSEEAGCEDDDREECPATGIKFISHPNNCEKFILCFNGIEIEQECPNGLHFSRELRRCTDPEEAECEDHDDREECPATGIKSISHPKNCEKFILCFNGIEIEQECPNGLHFSRELRRCTDPEEAECEDHDDREECPATGIKSISHPKNCEKFILCFNGIEIEQECPNGLHFSRELRRCTDPEEAECEDHDGDGEECPETGIKSISHPKNCEKFILCFNGIEIEQQCPNGLHFSRELRRCTDPEEAECEDHDDREECPATGIKSISHPKNCEKFILCFNGIEIEQECPNGLHFSRELRRCTDPEEAECEDHDDDREECPASGIKSIAHPKNCEKFILCFNGIEIEQECPNGLHFSRELRRCTDPEEAECEDHDDDREECPATGIKSIAHPKNCEKFILCFNGIEIEQQCPNGLHFSRELRQCTDPEEAECEDHNDDREECPATGIKSISHPKNCEKFILCFNGIEIEQQCPNGLHFSRELRRCTDPEEAECEDHDDDREECPATGIKSIAHPKNCEKFILCFNGIEIEQQCPNGLHFSRELRQCTDPEEAECEDHDDDREECPATGIKSISHPENCEKFILCFNGIEIEQECPNGLHFSRELRQCTDPEEAECEDHNDDREECPETGIKSISHPKNCEKFILCFNGIEIEQECPNGLHFSRELRQCTDPEEAECEDHDDDREECPETGIKSISHPENCEKFILCFNGVEIEQECPNGLHFSRELRQCTDPEEAECEDHDDDSEECPETGIKSISHPDSCEKFILCINGVELTRNCAPGLHFSRNLRSCASPDIAECEDNKYECPQDAGGNLVFLPNTEDCSRFYVCFDGEPHPLSCGEGLHWSVEHSTCMQKNIANCRYNLPAEV